MHALLIHLSPGAYHLLLPSGREHLLPSPWAEYLRIFRYPYRHILIPVKWYPPGLGPILSSLQGPLASPHLVLPVSKSVRSGKSRRHGTIISDCQEFRKWSVSNMVLEIKQDTPPRCRELMRRYRYTEKPDCSDAYLSPGPSQPESRLVRKEFPKAQHQSVHKGK